MAPELRSNDAPICVPGALELSFWCFGTILGTEGGSRAWIEASRGTLGGFRAWIEAYRGTLGGFRVWIEASRGNPGGISERSGTLNSNV